MRHIFIICFVLAGFTYPAYGLLPPFYQGAKEITAILNNPDIANKIGSGRIIKSIEKTDSGYRVAANECTLDVTITMLPPKSEMVGPAEFTINAGPLNCDAGESRD